MSLGPAAAPLLGALPERVAPMLAVARDDPFDSPDHIFEVWWEGLRVAAMYDSGRVLLRTQSGLDLTPYFPDITSRLATRVRSDGVVLDAILTAPDAGGVPHLGPLLNRIYRREGPGTETVVTLQVFDVLYKDHRPLMRYPLLRRKHTLMECVDPDTVIQLSHYEEGAGIAFYEAATRLGLPGAIAKEKTSPYMSGQRSPAWVQVLANREANVVVGGYTLADNGRRGPFGSVLVGTYAPEGLRFVGTVTGGFQKEDADVVFKLMHGLPSSQCPFASVPQMGQLLYWCQPALAARISYGEMSAAGQVQFAIFKGLRPDVDPRTCSIERLARQQG